ncbi:hypothetical protein C8J55DRAFT_375572, partial [Lentinula edodes]
ICQLRGTDQVFNTNCDHWNLRDVHELRYWANAYKNASNFAEQMKIWDDHGVRWSSLWLLDYWNPTRMLVIDSMHCLLEGLIQYHCRHVLRVDASSTKISSDGLKHAFDWPWIPYDDDLIPNEWKLSAKHIPRIANIHQTLCLALEGEKALTLDAMWTRLENGAPRDALRYVAHTLSLPTTLDDIHEEISLIYVKRAKKQRSTEKDVHQFIFPFSKPATQKNHFIALLLNWRLQQPLRSDAYILPTGTPETLAHIQHVIQHTTTPSWLNSVPKNYGDAKAGSIKADEWRTLSTVYLPIALITLWGDNDGCSPPANDLLLKALNHTMALFQAT